MQREVVNTAIVCRVTKQSTSFLVGVNINRKMTTKNLNQLSLTKPFINNMQFINLNQLSLTKPLKSAKFN